MLFLFCNQTPPPVPPLRRGGRGGVTLLEVMLAIAIMGILAVLGSTSYLGQQRTVELRGAARQVVESLRDAQSRARAGQDQKAWGVHFDTGASSFTVFRDEGGGFGSSTERDPAVYLSNLVTIASVTVNGGGSDVIFTRATGATTSYGTANGNSTAVELRQVNDASVYRRITVTASGKVDVQ